MSVDVRTFSRQNVSMLVPMVDAIGDGLRCLVLVTRSDNDYNGNNRRYTATSLRQAIEQAQERVQKRLMVVYYRHPSSVVNADTGQIVGFDYLQNPAVAFVESLEWDDATQEVWAIIQFYKGDPVADWLTQRITQGEMLPVSLRAFGTCGMSTGDGQECDVTFSDGFDILEPAEGDVPAMSDAGIKAILDCKCQQSAAVLDKDNNNTASPDTSATSGSVSEKQLKETNMLDEKLEARIKQLHELGVSWDVVEQVLSWDWGMPIDMEAARMLFESLEEPVDPVEDGDTPSTEATEEEQAVLAEDMSTGSTEEEIAASDMAEEAEDMCGDKPEDKKKPLMEATFPVTDAKTSKPTGITLSDNRESATPDKGACQMSQPLTDTIQARLSALDEIIREREAQRKRKEFESAVDAKLTALTDATETEKQQLRSLALQQADAQAGLVILDHEIKKLAEAKQNQALADAQRNAMGFTLGGQKGHTISVGQPARPYMELFDKVDAVIQDSLKVTTMEGISGKQRAEMRQERRKAIEKSENIQKFLKEFEAKNYHRLCDAITTSDVHGVSTAKNRETLLSMLIMREEFFMSTVIETLVQPLMPNSQFMKPFTGGSGLAAEQMRMGGVFVIPMESVSESSRAKAKFYRPERNVGAVELVNTKIDYSFFTTRSRRAAAVFDYENFAQLLTGSLNLDLLASVTLQVGAALGRSIDSEAIFTMLNDSREHEAVQVTGENIAATEWYYNAGGNVRGYGSNVVGVGYVLGAFAANSLENSTGAGSNKSPILVYPRTKSYVNGLTGDTTDYIPYNITMTLPSSTTPVLGYLDPADLQIKALVEGQTPTHAIDPMNGALLFTAASNVTGTNRPTAVSYWYATNYSTWSKAQGLWDVASASYPNPFPSGTPLSEKARGFVELISELGGELYEERNRYPDFALQKFGFGNGYTAKAATFEKRISPTDAELLVGYGAGEVIGQDAGIVHVKTANPEMPSTVLLGQRGATFFGLGYVFGLRNQNMDIAPSSGGLVQPGNGEYYMWGQLDAIGTPRFPDGRNFPYYEVVIID